MSYTSRRLPHWFPDGKPVFVTWHLHGSLPRNRYPPPGNLSAGEAFAWMDRFLDETRTGPRWLGKEPIAEMIVDAIRYGEQNLRHYRLGAFVVMPNHVHMLVKPKIEVPELMRRLKGFTARQANQMLNRTGETFWQRESYDHWVRNDDEWSRISRYIERNPVRAGLAREASEYPWSSAARVCQPPA